MKAIIYDKNSSGGGLKLEEIEKPVPADNQVLVKVRAASVNPLDYHLLKHPLLRRVIARATKGKIMRPGRDVAGEVEAVGRSVTQFKRGDEVFGACDGAFAEYACVPESALARKPVNVSFEQAAAVPVAGLTALQGLRDKAQIQPGQKVLINGAAGGIGTFAVQFAKAFGAEVTGVCSTRNLKMVQSIGADTVIDYTREDFTSSGQHYDVIFDNVSNHSFSDYKRALTPNGVYIGAGALALHGSMFGMLASRITELVMSPFVSQKFTSFIARLNQNDLIAIGVLMAQGTVTPVIDRHYRLSEVPEALHYLEQGHARGKVIIEFDTCC
ncbi:MAG TPA: NAD(P)-dependent alcohol dehydrogenase [Pyrinomonadaceae bacterium]|jgi:NADPH:quinone reductase-like Zn-dependent oxidoreductase|nr:NAD(P)-dependent alcohol dehydrogenase [Pyrinomonadaceae bacterium]